MTFSRDKLRYARYHDRRRSPDVWAAHANTMKAAEKAGRAEEVRERIRKLVASETFGERFVTKILGRELGL